MNRYLKILGLGVLLLLPWVGAQAQQVNLYCQTGSGTGPSSWLPWSTANPCPVSATFTPSGTQNVNITQILGAAPSLTNPLFVSPATGATFPVSGTVTATPGSQYPSGAVPLTATATGTTAATVATLSGTAGKTTYICGFTISADATTALAAAATVTGTISGSLNYIQNVGAATAAGVLTQTFNPCIPASATNTAIVITSAAAGLAGNTSVNGWGYQL
jgi:hypothetical protein